MKKTIAFIATGSLVALAAPAMAQSDSPFNGPRIGVIGGFDQSGAGSSAQDADNEDNDQSIEGFGYGIEAGYDIDTGGAVIGVEAEYLESTADTEFENPGDFESFGLGAVDANRDLYVGLRAGAKVSPNTLVYAKGGYTNAKYDLTAVSGDTEFSNDIDTDGYRLGAGVEYAMDSGMYIKGEYRYSNYSEAEVDMPGDAPDTERFDVDLDRHQVMAAVGWRF